MEVTLKRATPSRFVPEYLKHNPDKIRLLSAVVEQTADFVLLTNSKGIIEYVNPAFEAFTGFEKKSLIGKTPRVLKSGSHSQAFYKNLWDTILGGKVYKGILRNKKKDGTIFYSEKTITPLRNKYGITTHFISTDKDITELIKAEEKLLKQTNELTRSNADLERFAYIASHDLQAPLASIASFIQLLNLEYSPLIDDNGKTYIQYAISATNKLRSLVQDLLALAQINKVQKPFCFVDCNIVVNEALLNLQHKIRESGATIDREALPSVYGDPSQLLQLFQNILANAINYRSEAQPQIQIKATKEDNFWRFSISDNGIGIENKNWEKIFEPFSRLETSKDPGTGLGLSICKKVVENHGGMIWIESLVGTGSKFFFTLRDRH